MADSTENNSQTKEAVNTAFDLFRDGCARIAVEVYEKLLEGINGQGIERQRAIKERIRKVRFMLKRTPYMDALDVAEWLYKRLEEEAQRRNDLP